MIKRYTQFINESVKGDSYYYDGTFGINTDLDKAREELDALKKLENEMIFNYTLKEMIDMFKNSNYPKKFIEYNIYFFTLLYNQKFIDTLYEFNQLNVMSLNDANRKGKDTMDEKTIEALKSYRDILDDMVEKILGIKLEKFNEISDYFAKGAKKHKENREKSINISEEDPYGEEEWDNDTPEDRMRKAFEDEE